MRIPLLLAAVTLAAGCGDVTFPATVTGLQSLRISLKSPTAAELGTPGAPATHREYVVDVEAIDAKGRRFAEDLDLAVYLSFAGDKIGVFSQCGKNEDASPLARVRLVGGVATDQKIQVPRAFGTVTIWFEEPKSHAVGTSPPIYYANPTIPDVQTPLDLTAPTATYCSPFHGKNVTVDHATGTGKLVVTSVFINGYVIADTGSPFARMTDTGGFNHLFIFSFGRPPAAIVPGRVMGSVSGNVSKFVGFTEMNFPFQAYTDTVDTMLIPPPYVLSPDERPGGVTNNIRLLRLVSATVSWTGKLCPIDPEADDWKKYNNFGLHVMGVCDAFNTFRVALPGKTFGNFDPLALAPNTTITAVGMLRNFSGQNEATSPATLCATTADCAAKNLPGSVTCVEGTCRRGVYNFFTITPRDPGDITVN